MWNKWPRDIGMKLIERKFDERFDVGELPERLRYIYRRVLYGKEAYYPHVVEKRVAHWLELPETKELLAEYVLTR